MDVDSVVSDVVAVLSRHQHLQRDHHPQLLHLPQLPQEHQVSWDKWQPLPVVLLLVQLLDTVSVT